MNASVKSWINGKTNSATFTIDKVATGHKAHHTGTGVHDTRPRRERTRNSQVQRAIKENF
jgi:hypothetical protein